MDNLEQFILFEVSKGNAKAFEQLFFQYQPKVIAFLIGLTHDSVVSRDMAQEVFLSVWKDRKRLAQIKSISAYLYQMARFKAFDYFDHLTVTEQYVSEYLKQNAESQMDIEEVLFAREIKHIIDETVENMSPQLKKVYRMSREDGLSNEEIAMRLNISKRTVENHITAALSILRKVIFLWVLLTIV